MHKIQPYDTAVITALRAAGFDARFDLPGDLIPQDSPVIVVAAQTVEGGHFSRSDRLYARIEVTLHSLAAEASTALDTATQAVTALLDSPKAGVFALKAARVTQDPVLQTGSHSPSGAAHALARLTLTLI